MLYEEAPELVRHRIAASAAISSSRSSSGEPGSSVTAEPSAAHAVDAVDFEEATAEAPARRHRSRRRTRGGRPSDSAVAVSDAPAN